MTIHPIQEEDTTYAAAPYDSVWTSQEVPVQPPDALEQIMLAQDKLYVVLAITLIIWTGLAVFIFRTDRKIDRLEQKLDAGISGKNSLEYPD